MKLNNKRIQELAHLARLEFSEKEQEDLKKDLTRIIEFCNQLSEVDTEGIEPLIYMSSENNVLRSDEAKQTITKNEALKNAPLADSDYFKVPKVINK